MNVYESAPGDVLEPGTGVAPDPGVGLRGEAGPGAIGDELLRGLHIIRREQLYTGEMPTYLRTGTSSLEYRFSPLISTFVHDALGDFDPQSPLFQVQTLDLVPARHRPWFVRTVARIRRRIRAFVAWQEEANGLWRFFGQGSGLAPDAGTTACAAKTLLEGARVGSRDRPARHVHALKRFRSPQGPYFTWMDDGRGGYSWTDAQGRPVVGFDRVVNVQVYRFLVLAGEDVSDLAAYLWHEAASGDAQGGSPYYANPLSFFYILARTWRQVQLPGRAELAHLLVPRIAGLQSETGGFGGPLSTALALSALLDLEYRGPVLERARRALLDSALPWGGWQYENFVGGHGSPTWTTTLAMLSLARCDDLQ